jgi:hypothetical protein
MNPRRRRHLRARRTDRDVLSADALVRRRVAEIDERARHHFTGKRLEELDVCDFCGAATENPREPGPCANPGHPLRVAAQSALQVVKNRAQRAARRRAGRA